MRSRSLFLAAAGAIASIGAYAATADAADYNLNCPQVLHYPQAVLWYEWEEGPDWYGMYHSSGPNPPIGLFVMNCTTFEIQE